MRRLRRWWAPAVGVLLAGAGCALLARPVEYGWFAYTPAAGELFIPPFGTVAHRVGAVLLVGGLLVLAGWGGYLLGRRSVGGGSGSERG